MEERRITEITIGERRREALGDIQGLARNIGKHGLLHPVVIDDRGVLVAGHRRLEACRYLGWTAVPVRQLGSLTETELREIELDENLQRKDLTAYERAKTMEARIETAHEVASQVSETVNDDGEFRPKSGRNSRNNHEEKSQGGRPSSSGSVRDIAQRTGISRTQQQRIRAHVETADAYPVMQDASWKQDHVLRAKKLIDRLPESERGAAVAIATTDADDEPTTVLKRLEKLTGIPPIRRRTIINEAGSDIDAATDALDALMAPASRDRYQTLHEAVMLIQSAYNDYPEDVHTPRLRLAATEIRRVLDQMRPSLEAIA